MDLMFNIAMGMPGPFEMVIILVVIMLLFGAKRLPGLSRSLGKSLSEFKRGKEEGLKSGDIPEQIEPEVEPETDKELDGAEK